MVDRNLREFYTRVDRIERAHQKGYGFEALGTLGRSHYRKRTGVRIPVLAPLLFVVFVVFGVMAFKAVIHQGIGAQTYENRVEALWLGDSTDRIGAVLMQADPVTLWMSAQIGRLIH